MKFQSAKSKCFRVLTLLLVILMLLPLIASCKKDEESESDSETLIETEQYLDDLGEFDFGGAEFHSMSPTNEDGTFTLFDIEELTGSILEDSIFYRNLEIESRFNVVLSGEEDHYVKCYDTLQKEVMSQSGQYDAIMLINRNAYSSLLAGQILTPDMLPHLDLSKDYYMHDINSMCSIAGKTVLAYSDESVYTYQRATCIVFNKTMAANLHMDNLYDTVNSGEWTFEKFYTYMKQGYVAGDNGQDGDGKTAVYGLYGHGDYMFSTFFSAAGESYVTKNGKKLTFNSLKSEKMHTIAEQEIREINSGVIGYSYDYKKPNECYEVFKQGEAMFCATVVGKIPLLKDIDAFDYGVIPWPKYDSEQKQYHTRIVDAWLRVVPSSCANTEKASVILEALASGSAKHVYPAYYENYVELRSTRDPESIEMLKLIKDTRTFDWGAVTWTEDIRGLLEPAVFVDQQVSILTASQTVAGNVSKLIKDLDSFARADQ